MIKVLGVLRRDDEGISLVELVIGMAILAISMMGIAMMVMNSLGLARSNANRVVAANIAASEIEELLTLEFDELEALEGVTELGPVDVDGRTFDVSRNIYWSTNAADVGPCISGSADAADENVLRIDVSVTWTRTIGVQPVVSSTTVSPPVGVYDSGGGTIAVFVVDNDNEPVEGVSTRLYGPVETSPVTSTVVLTDEHGCAVFEDLGLGTYVSIASKPSSSGHPMIDIDQRISPFPLPATHATVPDDAATQLVGVSPRSRVTIEYFYAQANEISVTAEGWAGGTVPPGPYEWYFANSRGSSPAGGLEESAYAYPGDYTLWAGSCEVSDPMATMTVGEDDDMVRRWPDAVRDSVSARDPGGSSSATITFGTFDVTWDAEVLPDVGREVTLFANLEYEEGDCEDDTRIELGSTTVGSDDLRFALPWGTWSIEAVESGVPLSSDLVVLDPGEQAGDVPVAVLDAPTAPLPGPAGVIGPVLWLDADDPGTVIAGHDANAVSEWRDRNQPARFAGQSEAEAQPTYIVSPELNGRRALRFDGEGHHLGFDGSILAATDYTAFVVSRRLTDEPHNFYLGGSSTVQNSNLVLGYLNDTTLRYSHVGESNTADGSVSPYAAATPARVHTFVLDETVGMSSYEGGTLVGTSTSTDPLDGFPDAEIGRLTAGGSPHFFSGDLGEIIIYPRVLTTAEREAVEAYLTEKWVAVLPSFSDPSDLPGLQLWLDGAERSTLRNQSNCNNSGSSTRIRCWQDRSGNGRHATLNDSGWNDGRRPDAVSNAINGNWAVAFSSNQFLRYDGSFLAGKDYTVVMVTQRTANRSGYNYPLGGESNGTLNNNLHLGYRNNTTLAHAQWASDLDMGVAGYAPGEAPRLHTFRLNTAVGRNVYMNGSLIGEDLAPAARVPLSSNNNARVGRFLDTYFHGHIAEIVMYDRALSDPERQHLEAYLMAKWGLS